MGSASSRNKPVTSRQSPRSCLCLCCEARWPRLCKGSSINDERPAAHLIVNPGSNGSVSKTRLTMKRELAKACILELAQNAFRRRDASLVRKTRQEAILDGQMMPAFLSPRPREPGRSCNGVRQLVPAMVLPRWESFERFKLGCMDREKMSRLKICSDDGSQPQRLECMVCTRVVGGGEAILALVCGHIFCPICFEVFLRRRWADLASNLVDSSETEQIPCPLCSATLQRQDVHTLTEPEVLELAAQVALVDQFSAVSVPDRQSHVVDLSSQDSPKSTLAAVTATAIAEFAEVSQTTPDVPVSIGTVISSPASPTKLVSSIPPVSSPMVNSKRSLVHGKNNSGSFTMAKSVASEAIDNKLASTSSVYSCDLKVKSNPIPKPSPIQALPKPCVSPAVGYRTYNVSKALNTQQSTPPRPHRSVSMPIQPNDVRALQQQSPTLPTTHASSKKLPGAILTKQPLQSPPVGLVNTGALRRTLTSDANTMLSANHRKGVADNLAGSIGVPQISRPMHTARGASYVNTSQTAI